MTFCKKIESFLYLPELFSIDGEWRKEMKTWKKGAIAGIGIYLLIGLLILILRFVISEGSDGLLNSIFFWLYIAPIVITNSGPIGVLITLTIVSLIGAKAAIFKEEGKTQEHDKQILIHKFVPPGAAILIFYYLFDVHIKIILVIGIFIFSLGLLFTIMRRGGKK